MNKRGFSLVELLAVLVILGLLLLLISRTVTKTINDAKDKVTEKQEQSILNAAEMWSVDNSEKFDDIEEQRVSVGADIVFVLDITGSMKADVPGTNGKNRFEVMYEILNETLVELLNENDVRVSIILYRYNTCPSDVSGKYVTEDEIILPLDRYTIIDPSKPIFTYNKEEKFDESDDDIFRGYKATMSNLRSSSGENVTETTTKPTCEWTYYQYAFRLAYDDVFSQASGREERVPAVIFMSDGEPNFYTGNWQSPYGESPISSAVIRKGLTKQYGISGGANKRSALFHILTANYYRNKIDSAYSNYDLIFYTIGLGVPDNSLGEVILNPTKENIENFSNADGYKNSGKCSLVASGYGLSDYSRYTWLDYGKDASSNQIDKNDLYYCLYDYKTWEGLSQDYTYSDKYYGGENMSVDELKNAFESFTQQVIEATKITQVCVSVEDLYNDGYLSKDDIKLADGTAASTYVIMDYNEEKNQYGFTLAKTDQQIADCEEYYANANN